MSEKGHSVGITSCARAATSQDHAILPFISMLLYNSKTAGSQDSLKGQLGVGFLGQQEIILITISSYFGSRIIYYFTLNINNIHIIISIYTINTIYQQFISNLYNSSTSISIIIINTSSIYHTT